MQKWKQAAWILIPIAGMSMLTVLFVVLWQAMADQTTSINGLQQRLSDMEQSLQENPSVSTELLGQQLQQVQNNQRNLEDRISRTDRQQSELVRLVHNLSQQSPAPEPSNITPTPPLTTIP
jgi:septal ring factor EnvC (AmiA/AmiB activator)